MCTVCWLAVFLLFLSRSVFITTTIYFCIVHDKRTLSFCQNVSGHAASVKFSILLLVLVVSPNLFLSLPLSLSLPPSLSPPPFPFLSSAMALLDLHCIARRVFVVTLSCGIYCVIVCHQGQIGEKLICNWLYPSAPLFLSLSLSLSLNTECRVPFALSFLTQCNKCVSLLTERACSNTCQGGFVLNPNTCRCGMYCVHAVKLNRGSANSYLHNWCGCTQTNLTQNWLSCSVQ